MPYGMFPSNNDETLRWIAEGENASARLELSRTRECARLLLSQYDPVHMLGLDRHKLKVLLDFLQHHDPNRLQRECEAVLSYDKEA
jgi:hypothetical protein